MANLFGKSELSDIWKDRFQDAPKLKAYTDKGLKVDIEDSTIGKIDMTGTVFDGAIFRDNEWNETTGKHMRFSNTTFRYNTFNDIEFEDSTFNNVTFEDSEFNRASFYRSNFVGAKFVRCKFKSSSFQQTNSEVGNSTILFDTSTIENVEFAESRASFSFDHSSLTDISLTDLVLPSTLTFENSKLEDIDMDRSKLAKLVMDGVTGGGRSGSNSGSVAEIEVRNSEMGFSLNGNTLGKVSFVNSRLEGGFTNADIKELQINNCKGMLGFGLYQAKIETLQISNCPINNIHPTEATIQNFSITDATLVNSDFSDMKAKNFTLTNVTLDQTLDFSGAQVDNFLPKNVTKASGAQLKMDGSNLKF